MKNLRITTQETESQRLVRAQRLTKDQLAEIEALVRACQKREGLAGLLCLEPPRPVPGGETNQFLYYRDGALVGIITLPPDDEIELLGMVHPDHRRSGIGRALLEAAKTECRHRGAQTLLLVCEDASLAGKAFAQAMGGQYRFAEHSMDLDATDLSLSPPRNEPITIQRAGAADLDTLIRLASASFDHPEERRRTQITTWIDEPNQHFYLARLGKQAIGILRAAHFDTLVYLYTLSIRRTFRGRGFGRQLLESVIQELLAQGKCIRLEVNSENKVALSLYRSCGFKPVTTYLYYELQA